MPVALRYRIKKNRTAVAATGMTQRAVTAPNPRGFSSIFAAIGKG
jgi:hypothetical protein